MDGNAPWRRILTVLVFMIRIRGIMGNSPPQQRLVKPLNAQGQDKAWYAQVANILYNTDFRVFHKAKDKLNLKKSFSGIGARREYLKLHQDLKFKLKELKYLIDKNINHSKSFTDEMLSPGADIATESMIRPFFKLSIANSMKPLAPMTKRWFLFVDCFLSVMLKEEQSKAINLDTFVKHGKQRTWKFKQVSGTIFTVHRKRGDCFTGNTVTVPVGNIVKKESYPENYSTDKVSCKQPDWCDPCIIIGRSSVAVHSAHVANQHVFTFTLNKLLKLMLQFHKVHFELVGDHTCNIGSLNIDSILSGKVAFSLQYCGIHSSIPVHPPHKDVTATVSLWLWVSHTVSFSFSVVSSSTQVFSSPLPNVTTNLVWSLVLPIEKKYCGLLKLETEKYNVIMIVFVGFNTSCIRVIDGPGELSPQVNLAGSGSFQTRTFLCQILFSSQKQFHDWPTQVLRHHFVSNRNKKIISIQMNTTLKINYPETACSTSTTGICVDGDISVLEINAESNINFSIYFLKNHFAQRSLCTHGGLEILQILNKTKTQSVLELCSHDGILSERNFYIQGPKCLLVLYSQTEYGFFHTELMISTTNCSVLNGQDF